MSSMPMIRVRYLAGRRAYVADRRTRIRLASSGKRSELHSGRASQSWLRTARLVRRQELAAAMDRLGLELVEGPTPAQVGGIKARIDERIASVGPRRARLLGALRSWLERL